MSLSKAFLKAEQSFMSSQKPDPTPASAPASPKKRGPKPKEVKLALAATHPNTVEFFNQLLDDETEKSLWMMFITGIGPLIDENGQLIKTAGGEIAMGKIELSPISFNAFKRAVEYKRGLPIVTVRETEKREPPKVIIELTGAAPDFFDNQRNILKIG